MRLRQIFSSTRHCKTRMVRHELRLVAVGNLLPFGERTRKVRLVIFKRTTCSNLYMRPTSGCSG